MSAPVDVLAVMDRASDALLHDDPPPGYDELREARAAVATLIAAAAEKATDGCPCDSCEALRVAVRNCGGEA